MEPENTVPAATATTPPAAEPQVNSETGNAPGSEAAPSSPTSGEKLFTQADLDRAIDDRLKRERAKNETQAQKAQAEAEERRKVEQGDWQKLAEERRAQLDALTPKSELADRLSDIVAKQLETEIAAWPESVRAIMPDAESPLLTRIEWAERTRPLAQELMTAQAAQSTPPQNSGPVAPGLRFPAQHPGGNSAPQTTKTVAENTLHKAYAPRKPATS